MSDKEVTLVSDIERLVFQIQGVVSNRVLVNESGQIERIHILARRERDPERIAHDIETALLVQTGLQIDRSRLNIVSIEKEEGARGEARLKLVGFNLSVSESKTESRVELKKDDKNYVGQVESTRPGHSRLQLLAEATLNAVREYLPKDHSLALEDLSSLSLGGKEAQVVSISLVAPRVKETFIGSSFVKTDRQEAVVCAILDAINRYLGLVKA